MKRRNQGVEISGSNPGAALGRSAPPGMPRVILYCTGRTTSWGGLALPPAMELTLLQPGMENKTQKLPWLCQGSPSSGFHAWLDFAIAKSQ